MVCSGMDGAGLVCGRLGRLTHVPAEDAGRSSRLRRLPLPLLVGAVALTGATTALLAIRFGSGRPILGSPYPQWQLAAGLAVLACLAEVAYVRLRHGESTEDLTFFEAVVVAAALLLPAAEALGVTMVGLVLASVVIRRPLVKVVFNLGSYAGGASALILLAHATTGPAGALGARTVLGIVAGTVAFAAVNLCALAAVLTVVEGGEMRKILSAEWQLSAIMALGNAGAGMMAVEVGLSAPALLPFVALPVLTLAHSYRSAVRHAEEQQRNRWLAVLGAVLAGQDDGGLLLPATDTARKLFAASQAHIVLFPGGSVVADDDGVRLHEPEPVLVELVHTLGDGTGPRVVRCPRPPVGCRRAVAVALDLGAPLLLELPDRAWFDVAMMQKDLRLALGSAGDLNVPLPSAATADGMLSAARAGGYEHRDIAVLFQVLSELEAMPVGWGSGLATT
jgi:hypothetical protein